MLPFRLSTLALACSTLVYFPAIADEISSEQAQQNIERVTVYGRQNKIVMESGLATKSNMSLMETPAAVVIVDKALIEAQGITDLQDLLIDISGVTQAGNNYGIGDNVAIRGLGANYTYDGMYGGAGLGNSFNPTRSLTNVDSVEVLKGPATGLYGMGSAGGVINLIEKKPQFISSHSFTSEIGAWDTYSISADSTAAITDKLAYRVVAKSARSDGYRGLGTDRDEIYTSLKYLISDNQDILFTAAYIDDAIAVDSIGNPIRIFNSASVGGKAPEDVTWEDLVNDPNGNGLQLTDEQRKQLANSLKKGDGVTPHDLGDTGLISPLSKANSGEELRFKVHHNVFFSDNLFLNQQLQYRNYKTDFTRQTGAYNYVYWDRSGVINADPRAPLVEDGVIYPFSARRQEYRQVNADEKSWQYFADLRYDFQLGEYNNELLVNANFEDRSIRSKQYSIYDKDKVITDKATGNVVYQGQLDYIYDIRNPNFNDGKFEDYDPLLTSNYDKGVQAWGIGIQHVGYWGDHFTTRVGVAFNEIKQTYQHLGVDPRYSSSRAEPTPEADSKDNGVTYNLGVTYSPMDNLSIFANHSKGRTAYSVLGSVVDEAEANRDDSESISNDLGFRVKGFDDQLLASLVFFKSARTNLRYGNPEYDDQLNPDVPEFYYDGKEETQGVELDLNAQLNEQWMINVNGMYQDARDKKDPNRSTYDTRQKGVPLVTASAWVTYSAEWFKLDEPLKLSLGAHFVDKRTAGSSSFGVPDGYVPSYTVVNSAVSYQWNDISIQLNINNVFNKAYYQKALFLGGLPGEERNAKLTFTYQL
ncbi:TonB-dependent receptor [Shewanella sp. OPT22]|nr:TonB-dependent receptor [Shewanella sp. OPT22]